MKGFGVLLMLGGAAAMAYGLVATGSVPSASDYGSRVVNIGLMGEKLIVTLIGVAAFVSGGVFSAAAAVAAATWRVGQPEAADRPAREPPVVTGSAAENAGAWRVVAFDAEEVETDGRRWRWEGEVYNTKWQLKEAIRASRRT